MRFISRCAKLAGSNEFHFHDHSDPTDPIFIYNPEEAPCDPESREFFLQGAPPPCVRDSATAFCWDTKTTQGWRVLTGLLGMEEIPSQMPRHFRCMLLCFCRPGRVYL